jgi:hypothetical protein
MNEVERTRVLQDIEDILEGLAEWRGRPPPEERQDAAERILERVLEGVAKHIRDQWQNPSEKAGKPGFLGSTALPAGKTCPFDFNGLASGADIKSA